MIGVRQWLRSLGPRRTDTEDNCIAQIQIKDVHSSVSYQWAIYQKYDWCGHELSSGHGALGHLLGVWLILGLIPSGD